MRDGYGVCPVCNGSGRKPADEEMKKYANVIAGYDKSNDTVACNNCGGQGMYGNNVHQAVFESEESETGITLHFVNEHFDEGRIIAQFYCEVTKNDTTQSIQAKVQKLEHTYFPIVIEKTILN